MATSKEKQQEFRKRYQHLRSRLILEESKTYDKNGMPIYDMICPLCNKPRGKLRMQAAFLPCKKCGQLGKKSPVKGRTRSAEFKQKISDANLRYRRKLNPNYKVRTKLEERLVHNMRTRLWQGLKGISKSAHTLDLLGCSLEELRMHLEKQFYNNPRNNLQMTWDNLGRSNKSDNTWHVDHIKPLAAYDLSDPIQLKEATCYTNLQPMWAQDNLSKGDRV